jgi:hypothetical protein
MHTPILPRTIHKWAPRIARLAWLSPLWVLGAPAYCALIGHTNIFSLISAALVGGLLGIIATVLFTMASVFAYSAVRKARRTFRDILAWLFAGQGICVTLAALVIVPQAPL